MKPMYLMAYILTILCIVGLMVSASFADPNDVINVKVNQSFNIVLASNPSTGYSWNVDYDDNYLELVDQSFQSSNPGLLGAGGNETFIFKALKPGKTSINLTYQRGSDIINTTAYDVVIAGVNPANNTTNNTKRTIPMQGTGAPLITLALGVLSVAAGLIISKRR